MLPTTQGLDIAQDVAIEPRLAQINPPVRTVMIARGIPIIARRTTMTTAMPRFARK